MPRIGFFSFSFKRLAQTPEQTPRRLTKQRPASKPATSDRVEPAEVGAGSGIFCGLFGARREPLKAQLSRTFNNVREAITRPVVTRDLQERITNACMPSIFEHHVPVWASDVFDLLAEMDPKLAGNRSRQAKISDNLLQMCVQKATYIVAKERGFAYAPFKLAAQEPTALAATMLKSRTPTPPPIPARNPRRKSTQVSSAVEAFRAEIDAIFNGSDMASIFNRSDMASSMARTPSPQPEFHAAAVEVASPRPQRVDIHRILPSQSTLATRHHASTPSPFIELGDTGTPFLFVNATHYADRW